MADSGGIRAGKAFVELSTNNSALLRGLDQAAKKLKDFGSNISDIGKRIALGGAAMVAPLLFAAQQFAAQGDKINKASVRTGVGVEALQELGYAAEHSGASFEDLETGIKKMQKTIFGAASGSKEAQSALASIGLTVQDLKNLSPDQQFALIGDRLNNITDASARTAVAMEIFGKGGTALLPLFAEGAAGMQKLRDRARELGIVFSKDDAQAATKFTDELEDCWKQVRALTFQVGAAVATALLPFAGIVHQVLRAVIDWTREHRNLVIGVLIAGAALMTLGTAIFAIGFGIQAVGFALSGITAGFKLVGSAVGLLSNPIILVGALLVGLVAYFVYASGNGGKLLSWLGDKFNALFAIAQEAFNGIADALSAGDIALAAQILWTALKLAWATGTQDLKNRWIEFKAEFKKTLGEAFFSAVDMWIIVAGTLSELWAKASASFAEGWHEAIADVTRLFDGFQNHQRQAEKDRIKRELAKPDLAPNVRALNERQLRNIDEQGDQVVGAQERKDAEDKIAREKALQERIASIKDEMQKRFRANDADRHSDQDANASAEKRALEKEKEDLQKQLDELRKKAGKEKKEKKDDAPIVDPKKLMDLDDVVANSTNIRPSAGIFNAAAIQSLQGDSTQNAIQKNTADSAMYLQRIAEGGAIFL